MHDQWINFTKQIERSEYKEAERTLEHIDRDDLSKEQRQQLCLYEAKMFFQLEQREQSMKILEDYYRDPADPFSNLDVEVRLLKAKLLWHLGYLNEGVAVLRPLEDNLAQVDESFHASFYHLLGTILQLAGDLRSVIDYYEKALAISKKKNDLLQESKTLNNIATFYHTLGKVDTSMEYFLSSVEIKKKLGNQEEITTGLINLGLMAQNLGDLTKGLKFLQEALVIARRLGKLSFLSDCLNHLGLISMTQGELSTALEYLEEGLSIQEQVGDQIRKVALVENLGTTYMYLGNYQLALDYHKQGLEINKKLGNPGNIARSLFSIIDLLLKMDRCEFVRSYQDELDDLAKNEEQQENKNTLVLLLVRLAKALALKGEKGLVKKAEALRRLEELNAEPMINYDYTLTIQKALAELYLVELKVDYDQLTWEKYDQLVSSMVTIAKEQQIYTTLVEVTVLKAKNYLVQDQPKRALETLKTCLIMAKEKNLDQIADMIEKELKDLQQLCLRWRNLVNKDHSFYERLQTTQLIDYLQYAASYAKEQDKGDMIG